MLNRAGKVFFVASFLAFSVAIFWSSQPPLLRDYPDWIYQGVLFAKVLAGHPVAGYALKHYPIPNSITTLGLGLLTLAFGWMFAAKLWLFFTLVLSACTSFYVARTLHVRDSAIWWILPGTLFFGQTFWYATVSFAMGLNLLLILACFLYRRRDGVAVIAGLLFVCFFTHLIVYAAAVLMLLLYCIQHRSLRLVYVAAVTFPLPIWYFLGRSLTHSTESALGYTTPAHLVPPLLAALVLLAIGWVWPRRSVASMLAPILPVLSILVVGLALLSALIPSGYGSARIQSAINLLQLKALDPFELFGFVNITYKPVIDGVLSSTLTLLHRPLFLLSLATDILCGIVILVAIARAINQAKDEESNLQFLWNFVAIVALLYFVTPPNALGVIALDMRLVQLAFGPVLFLLARTPSTALRLTAIPIALLTVISLSQFVVSQHRRRIEDTETALPVKIGHFCAVDPIILAEEYDRIRSNHLDGFIFATGLFVRTTPLP